MTSYLRQKFQSLTSSSGTEDVKEEELNSENREEIERRKIEIMKAVVQKQDPSVKVTFDLLHYHFTQDHMSNLCLFIISVN